MSSFPIYGVKTNLPPCYWKHSIEYKDKQKTKKHLSDRFIRFFFLLFTLVQQRCFYDQKNIVKCIGNSKSLHITNIYLLLKK